MVLNWIRILAVLVLAKTFLGLALLDLAIAFGCWNWKRILAALVLATTFLGVGPVLVVALHGKRELLR